MLRGRFRGRCFLHCPVHHCRYIPSTPERCRYMRHRHATPGQKPPRASLVILALLKKPVFHLILKSLTVTGSEESCRIPSPKAPFSPAPQHLALPSERMAQVCQALAAITAAVIDSANRNRDKSRSLFRSQLTIAVLSPAFYGFVGKQGTTVKIPYPNRYGIVDIKDGNRDVGGVVVAITQFATAAVPPTSDRAIR